ncbi:MAG: hypothetical protein HY200_01260 [Nitrospirae bacterium]|nr:hypothetical protein [Nitrospirota bacterium]MBI3593565.1 hypothetical protein [Nitrospirota bacterium]
MLLLNKVSKENFHVVECSDLARLGGPNDGGYVISMNAIRKSSLLLSFGVSKDWKFEREVMNLRPEMQILAYDHTIGPGTFFNIAAFAWLTALSRFLCFNARDAKMHFKRWQNAIDYFNFFKGNVRHIRRRVWYNTDRESASIIQIIASLDTLPECSVLAKIDIEGSEYRILPEVIQYSNRFSGLIVEFHDIDISVELFNAIVLELSKEFYLVHIHGNNFSDLNKDHDLPNALEMTWIHKKLLATEPKPFVGSFPRAGLDAPNNPDAGEYKITF